MNYSEFIGSFVGSFIGIAIYEALVYYSGPYEIDWLHMLYRTISIAAIIAVVTTIMRWRKNKNPK